MAQSQNIRWVGIAANNNIAVDDINEQWDWGADYTYNFNTGRIPNETLLQQARTASTLHLVIATVSLFFLSRMIINRPVAYVASFYFTLNPVILLNGRRAMMEGNHIAGMILIVLVSVWVIQQRKWWQFIILGLIAGYAIASKHPNAIVIGLICVAYFTLGLREVSRAKYSQWQSLAKMNGGIILAGIFTLLSFYVLNPAWWEMPIESGRQALSLRNELLQMQTQTFDSYSTVAERVEGFFNFVFIAQPQYFEDAQWTTYSEISQQIQAYHQTPWSGFAIGGSQLGGIVVLLLTLFGILHFSRNPSIRADSRWVILVWGIGICMITFLLTPLSWQRYYLPVYPFVGLMTAYGVIILSDTIWKRVVK